MVMNDVVETSASHNERGHHLHPYRSYAQLFRYYNLSISFKDEGEEIEA